MNPEKRGRSIARFRQDSGAAPGGSVAAGVICHTAIMDRADERGHGLADFPPNYVHFSLALQAAGANVLGIGDMPPSMLDPRLGRSPTTTTSQTC